MSHIRTVLLASIVFVLLTIFSFRLGQAYTRNMMFGNERVLSVLMQSVKEGLGLERFYGQIGQDRWLVRAVYPGVSNGFFVDVGSADGEFMSNTKKLEELDWKGICIDPFPTNMHNRNCQMLKEVVSDVVGEKIEFRVAEELGGIEADLGQNRELLKDFPVQEFQTTTLAEILKQSNAPKFIHYINIDIEGAEYKALKGFPFNDYSVGTFTIEHNYESEKRQQIHDLLVEKGYYLVKSFFHEDWYLRR